jgi:hypothetical protein
MFGLRRLLLLGVLGGVGFALWKRFVQGPHVSTPGAPVTYQGTPSPARAADTTRDADTTRAVSPTERVDVSALIEAPAEIVAPAEPATTTQGFAAVSQGPTAWVPPIDGACPDGYPIKANANSGIFHLPGGRFYERTVPERCYANADAALADGYRQAKA